MSDDRAAEVKEQMASLLQAGFIQDLTYSTWLLNVVLVRNPNRKWRMCMDYSDLNIAYPKDSFPLPSIDNLVDSTSRYKYLSFMDAYSGYNQIPMHPPDEEKIAFIMPNGIYYYTSIKYEFSVSNNQAEYEAIIAGVTKAKELGIITQFRILDILISENGTQFANKRFKSFLEGLGIRQHFSSVEHPQANDQVKAANKCRGRNSGRSQDPSPRFLLGVTDYDKEKDLLDKVREFAHLRELALKQWLALRDSKSGRREACGKLGESLPGPRSIWQGSLSTRATGWFRHPVIMERRQL
ncbi:uncharacterized protein LOC107636953 [Arachis ipaensis]|uniref:uncharacterized protein LOC107636953 n=1 Tax=Arachis ipaensis TaxID=130454 RepID=UPI0007AF42AB|nr:uncharacterized protein LOC107636953 [Arachis ipaensis]XP_025648048.1 uncharacterized protein LOC112743035 [Arachis hypogaea]